MNVLEKILEEIEHEAMTNKEIGRKQCEGMARAMNIVSSHLNEFLNCEIGNNCHVYDIDKIIRSHMDDEDNDGWIPVEDGLPEETTGKYYPEMIVTTSYGAVTWGFYRVMDKQWYIYSNIHNEFVKAGDKDIVAWRPLPEPYRPKKDIEDSGARS